MKKQRKPIILVLVLAALCGGAAIMNKPQPTAQDQAQAQAKETPEESKSGVAGDVQAKMAETKPSGVPAKFHRPKNMPGGDGPALLKPKMEPYKPKPNDSATSTQWYTDESPRK